MLLATCGNGEEAIQCGGWAFMSTSLIRAGALIVIDTRRAGGGRFRTPGV